MPGDGRRYQELEGQAKECFGKSGIDRHIQAKQ